MKMFAKRATEKKLEPRLIHLVKYAIRKHSRFQIFPTKTLEARLLEDLDNLEEWSLARLESLREKYLASGEINPGLLRLAKFWFVNFMAKTTKSALYFNWSKTEFMKRKKAYFEEVNKLLLQHRNTFWPL